MGSHNAWIMLAYQLVDHVIERSNGAVRSTLYGPETDIGICGSGAEVHVSRACPRQTIEARACLACVLFARGTLKDRIRHRTDHLLS